MPVRCARSVRRCLVRRCAGVGARVRCARVRCADVWCVGAPVLVRVFGARVFGARVFGARVFVVAVVRNVRRCDVRGRGWWHWSRLVGPMSLVVRDEADGVGSRVVRPVALVASKPRPFARRRAKCLDPRGYPNIAPLTILLSTLACRRWVPAGTVPRAWSPAVGFRGSSSRFVPRASTPALQRRAFIPVLRTARLPPRGWSPALRPRVSSRRSVPRAPSPRFTLGRRLRASPLGVVSALHPRAPSLRFTLGRRLQASCVSPSVVPRAPSPRLVPRASSRMSRRVVAYVPARRRVCPGARTPCSPRLIPRA
jgi:hypothetical protein